MKFKNEELMVLGLAALAVYMITRANKTSAGAFQTGGKSITQTVSEIFNLGGGAFDNGWRYFTDGTAIDPQGDYYKNGQLIWSNASVPMP